MENKASMHRVSKERGAPAESPLMRGEEIRSGAAVLKISVGAAACPRYGPKKGNGISIAEIGWYRVRLSRPMAK